jgi:hypothetical protein
METLKNANNGKIKNITASVRISLFMDGAGYRPRPLNINRIAIYVTINRTLLKAFQCQG